MSKFIAINGRHILKSSIYEITLVNAVYFKREILFYSFIIRYGSQHYEFTYDDLNKAEELRKQIIQEIEKSSCDLCGGYLEQHIDYHDED